jgi:hypothetical protein
MTDIEANSDLAVPERRPFLMMALLLGLGFAATAPSLRNGFAYDDEVIVATNESVHTLAAPWTYTQHGYWPAGGVRLFRPVTIWLYALQWKVGDGSPLAFHVVNVMFYLAGILALYLVAARLLPPPGAWLAAALFAVHPVHVEAVGNVVGQAELNVGLSALLGLLVYLEGRRLGAFSLSRRIVLALLLAWGGLAKEQGLMLPVLLLVAEVTVVHDPRSWGQRARSLLPVALLQVVAVLLVLTLRLGAVGFGGMEQAIAIRGVAIGQRALTMLSVVPHWVRLLFWPTHLQADYSPLEIVAASGFGWSQLLGCVLIGVWIWGVWRSWSRSRTIAFGLLWLAVTLFPVSNVLLPTGIVLAERTLYLPSMGAVLVLGAMASWAWAHLGRRSPIRVVGVGLALAVLAAAGWRSANRQAVWRDSATLVATTVDDAPRSYRARWQYAKHMVGLGNADEALRLYREAMGLYDRDPLFLEDYGHRLRDFRGCQEALPLFQRALAVSETRVVARSRLYYCLLALDRISEARQAAARGAALGDSAFVPLVARADSLMAARAPTDR